MIPLAVPVEVPSWPTCQIVYHTHGVTKQDRKAIKKATRKISKVTGITFVKGSGGIEIKYHRYSEPLVLGMGGYLATPTTIVDGWVHLSTAWKYKLSKKDKQSLFMHEVAHSLGANHVNSPGKVMSPILTGKTSWSHIDKKELRKVAC
mgnify:FL=1